MLKRYLIALCSGTFFIYTGLSAQEKDPASKQPELEGLKITGLPLISFSSDDGTGYGVRIYGTYYERNYAPFKFQTYGQYYRTTKGFEYHEASLDALRFLGSPYRVRINAGLERYLNAQYYGYSNYQDIQRQKKIKAGEMPINENVTGVPDLYRVSDDITLNTNFINNPGAPLSQQLNPSKKQLKDSQDKYFNYDSIKPFLTATTEDWFGNSNFKWFAGFRLQRYRIQSYEGDKESGNAWVNNKTLIDLEKPTGYDATEDPRFVNSIRLALAYDSRPRERELNPNDGTFTDLHYEGVGKGTGSHYTFHKYTLTWRQYYDILPSFFNRFDKELVFAYRLLGQYTIGDAPFFELGRIYTMRESALGLGGNGGIRGYPANQFVDRLMTVFNTELRLTSYRVSALGGIDFVILAYYDVGRVAHTWEEWMPKDMHRAGGGGLRLVWQKNTIINISSGRSKYESNTNFSFNHMF
jgi:hypothetical protein